MYFYAKNGGNDYEYEEVDQYFINLCMRIF